MPIFSENTLLPSSSNLSLVAATKHMTLLALIEVLGFASTIWFFLISMKIIVCRFFWICRTIFTSMWTTLYIDLKLPVIRNTTFLKHGQAKSKASFLVTILHIYSFSPPFDCRPKTPSLKYLSNVVLPMHKAHDIDHIVLCLLNETLRRLPMSNSTILWQFFFSFLWKASPFDSLASKSDKWHLKILSKWKPTIWQCHA